MYIRLLLFVITSLTIFSLQSQNLTIFKSKCTVGETTEKLEKVISRKGLKYFETVAHHEIASERGYVIDSTNVILFEDPRLTSKLIQCQQTVALDLPMKILVWEENRDVYIGFVDPALMRKRFLLRDCENILEEMTSLIVRVTNEVIKEN